MAIRIFHLLFLLVFSIICSLLHGSNCADQDSDKRSYIVYMGELPKGEVYISSLHFRMLQQHIGSFSPESLVHSYKRSFNGFVAKLSKAEAKKIAGLPGVVSVFPNEKNILHTTRSWDFMGFSQHVPRTTIESDIIIGILDTGIWPESESFNDEEYGPPPSKWKGSCQASSNFTCNNKIIGAKFYRADNSFESDDFVSPRDSEGHGTHTSSTAAGGLVSMASLYGLAAGTARGGVPSARIAVYKICWSDGCSDADVLAAFDDAIADGVDIISISVGWPIPRNEGPNLETIKNFSPWSLSVAASTIDRKFLTKIQLGNDKTYEGISINAFDLKNVMYPIIYGGDAPNFTGNFTASQSRLCLTNSLDSRLVQGKIVLCDRMDSGEVQLLAGAVGTVMQDSGFMDVAWSFPLPASYIDTRDGSRILSYINSTSYPTATIYKSNEVNDTFAPYVVSFSSRGPNPATLDLLKPDVSAPGVDILAAWSLASSVSEVEGDNRMVPYNIMSGTSMACPHATGAAAYVKSYHPTWSPAAIKSALMTTAFPMSPKLNPQAEFAYGSGHINPVRAINPGLVYDAEPIDYIKFLCGQGYKATLLRMVSGDNSSCSETINGTVWDLNYPSFALSTSASDVIGRVFNRVVTNVGSPTSTYRATVAALPGLKIQVNPSVLSFASVGQKLSFVLTIEGTLDANIVSSSLVWDDGVHQKTGYGLKHENPCMRVIPTSITIQGLWILQFNQEATEALFNLFSGHGFDGLSP